MVKTSSIKKFPVWAGIVIAAAVFVVAAGVTTIVLVISQQKEITTGIEVPDALKSAKCPKGQVVIRSKLLIKTNETLSPDDYECGIAPKCDPGDVPFYSAEGVLRYRLVCPAHNEQQCRERGSIYEWYEGNCYCMISINYLPQYAKIKE
jgi:hypothetical protein